MKKIYSKKDDSNIVSAKIDGSKSTTRSRKMADSIKRVKKYDFDDIDGNPYRQLSADLIDFFDGWRGHTTKGERYYELEDELTAWLMKDKRLDL